MAVPARRLPATSLTGRPKASKITLPCWSHDRAPTVTATVVEPPEEETRETPVIESTLIRERPLTGVKTL